MSKKQVSLFKIEIDNIWLMQQSKKTLNLKFPFEATKNGQIFKLVECSIMSHSCSVRPDGLIIFSF